MKESYRLRTLVKCLQLARLLADRQTLPTWSEMARELGVCKRTARRYVAALEEARWPVPAQRLPYGERQARHEVAV